VCAPLAPREKVQATAIAEDALFKEKELDQLEKKIQEVEKWRDEKLEEQAKLPLSEMPKLTVSLINSKVRQSKINKNKYIFHLSRLATWRARSST
jgi:hypothetical protein